MSKGLIVIDDYGDWEVDTPEYREKLLRWYQTVHDSAASKKTLLGSVCRTHFHYPLTYDDWYRDVDWIDVVGWAASE